jgi:hypothetical protein
MKTSDAIRLLAGLRLMVGVNSWVTPRLSGRILGMNGRDGTAPYLNRLFAARDTAMAVGSLQSSGDAQRQWLQLGLAVDVVDVFAALASHRRGELQGVGSVAAIGAAAAAAGLGAVALAGNGAA